ncbi:MAG: TVP38/TMEM64 family protein, partial [Myxococcales bacterium]|nr:TVP38/TMEM64 family protein [Myxococcales bacterium]
MDPAEPQKPLLKIVAIAIALVVLLVLGRAAGGYVQGFAQWVDGLGFWGPAVFVFGYVIAVVAFVPASLLTGVAGAIFGIVHGVIYVFVAATIGSCLAFLISRYLARSAVE